MSGDLCLRNPQETRPVDLRFLRRVVRHLLSTSLKLEDFDVTIRLVNAAEMTRVNESLLHHAGSTDVITLDYSSKVPRPLLAGELLVCVDEAVLQGRRYRTTWQVETARYIVHGVLHLLGHDDRKPAARRRMKREEERLLREVARDFRLRKLLRKTKIGL